MQLCGDPDWCLKMCGHEKHEEDSSHCACVAKHSNTADRLALGLVLELGT